MTSRSDKQTGGPAFPHTVEYKGAGCAGVVPHGGMTLRDYFAAKAMLGLMASPHMPGAFNVQPVADKAYMIADAMLEARDGSR